MPLMGVSNCLWGRGFQNLAFYTMLKSAARKSLREAAYSAFTVSAVTVLLNCPALRSGKTSVRW